MIKVKVTKLTCSVVPDHFFSAHCIGLLWFAYFLIGMGARQFQFLDALASLDLKLSVSQSRFFYS